MLNKYIDMLTPEQEDRLLTKEFLAYLWGHDRNRYTQQRKQYCLVDRANDKLYSYLDYCGIIVNTVRRKLEFGKSFRYKITVLVSEVIPSRYDYMCSRWGNDVINQMIRNRILRNRARRTLQALNTEIADGVYTYS